MNHSRSELVSIMLMNIEMINNNFIYTPNSKVDLCSELFTIFNIRRKLGVKIIIQVKYINQIIHISGVLLHRPEVGALKVNYYV